MATLRAHLSTAPVPTGSTFEADLRAVREARGHSLDEIQKETRIPVDVLRRFEDGDLIGDPNYNPVYLKAFLQQYARAVGLPQGPVLGAYQAHQNGSYRGELHPESTATPPAVRDEPPAAAPSAPPVGTEAEREPAPVQPSDSAGPARRTGAPPAVEALATTPVAEERRAEAGPKPDLGRTRVSRPAVAGARRSFDKNWGVILGLFAVVALAIAGVLYVLVFAGDDGLEGEDVDTVAIGGAEAAIDSAGVGAGAAGGGPQLQLPITVTVTAAEGGLQWFRVTSDGGDRTPYWIDGGGSQTFRADSALVLWGEGSEGGPQPLSFADATVEIQGQPFTPRSGAALRITRETGQRLLDSLAAAAGAAPPPPPAAGPAPEVVDETSL